MRGAKKNCIIIIITKVITNLHALIGSELYHMSLIFTPHGVFIAISDDSVRDRAQTVSNAEYDETFVFNY